MQQKPTETKKAILTLTGGLGLLLFVVILAGCGNQPNDTSDATETVDKTVERGAVIGVEEAVRNAEADTVIFSVEGVVLTATPEDNLVTMIGLEAYKSCGLSDCCLYLPVLWHGEMPGIEEVVTVTGAIEATDSGLIFTARELRVAEITDSL